jgi:hypothetical protein
MRLNTKLMKNTFLCVIFLCSFSVYGQNKDTLSFAEFLPYYSNNIDRMPYDVKVNNSPTLYNNGIQEEIIRRKYEKLSINIKGNIYVKDNWFAVIGVSIGGGKYISVLEYKDLYYKDTYQMREEINSLCGEIDGGMGKLFYMDAAKRVILMPEFVASLSIDRISGNVKKRQWIENSYENQNVRFGAQVNIKVMYCFKKYIGIGVSCNEILGLNKLNLTKKEDAATNVNQQKFELNIGVSALPRLSLVVFLK